MRAATSATASRAGRQSSTSAPSGASRKGRGVRDLGQGGRKAETQAVPQADQPLVPAIRPALELADRQGVEEFVGDQEEGAVGQILHPFHPVGRRSADPRQGLGLHGAELGRGLDQHQTGGGVEPRHPRVARRRSAISVPRPGPSSARVKGSGAPRSSQACARARPKSSPNIWLISGAVVKSPAAPKGSRVV